MSSVFISLLIPEGVKTDVDWAILLYIQSGPGLMDKNVGADRIPKTNDSFPII